MSTSSANMSNVEKEVGEEYASSLSDLIVNNKPLINMLTMLAHDNIMHAPIIVQTVERHLQQVIFMVLFDFVASWGLETSKCKPYLVIGVCFHNAPKTQIQAYKDPVAQLTRIFCQNNVVLLISMESIGNEIKIICRLILMEDLLVMIEIWAEIIFRLIYFTWIKSTFKRCCINSGFCVLEKSYTNSFY